MRWYDLEPDVSMAISMIECSNELNRVKYAKEIIELIKSKDKDMLYLRNSQNERLSNGYRRWYDQDDTLYKAFQYLKATSKKKKKEVSLAILSKINPIE